MKKAKYYLCILSLTIMTATYAQIGINTTAPLGVFHIDTGGDNSVTGIINTSQQINDFVITTDQTGNALVGVGVIPVSTSPAQLDLAATNKALLLNRVSLESVKDVSTVPNPIEGMLVYNNTTDGVYPDNVIPSPYYHNGLVWSKIETGTKTSVSNIRLLQQNVISTPVSDIHSGVNTAITADFGEMKITEQGAYTFALRLYGFVRDSSAFTGTYDIFERSQIYIYLIKDNTSAVGDVIVDMFEINTVMFQLNGAFTYTAILRGEISDGETVKFKLANKGAYSWEWKAVTDRITAARTSLVFWKG